MPHHVSRITYHVSRHSAFRIPQMATHVAVVIGINYTDPAAEPPPPGQTRARMTPLRWAQADAEALAAALGDAGYAVTRLLGTEATREAMIAAIEQQSEQVTADGVFVVYFAGHGDVDGR